MCMICALRTPNDPLARLNQHLPAGASPSAANPGDFFWSGFGAVRETTDAPGTTGTTYSLIVGQSAYGTISSATDEDWFAVTLEAGVTYNFRMLGLGAGFIEDPLLRLRDASGVAIATDDDGFTSFSGTHETDSELVFTAATTGTYYLSADAFSTETGDYLLTIAPNDANGRIFTVDEIAWQLINNGESFFGSPEGAAFDVGVDGSLTVNITGLTAEGRNLARNALEAWTLVTGINFVETGGAAEITFDDAATGAFAQPLYSGTTITSSTVNVGTDWLTQFGTTFASYSFETYIHEIGHALGLGHGGNYNGSATYGIDNYYINDSVAWSIMSYMNAFEDEFDSGDPGDVNTYVDGLFRYIFTPQIADIIAIQNLYGGFNGAFTGNTTYGFGANTGIDAIDGAVNSGRLMAMTVYDNGGIDTLNFASTTENQLITLQAEALSSVLGGRHNLGIARGVDIENAVSGSGNDNLFGNRLNNSLSGGAGNDTIAGGVGNDSLLGGGHNDRLIAGSGNDELTGATGNDFMDGGDGRDRVIFTGATAATVNLGLTTAQVTGYGTDRILNVEDITSGSGSDRLIGNTAANSLKSGIGLDTLNGGAGSDFLFGGAGNDLLTGGTGGDTFVFDSALGASNIDRISDFNVAADTIRLDDAVFAGLAAGMLAGAAFAANLTGNAGDASDRIIYETDTGRLYFDAGGTVSGARVHFATLAANLALTAADFFVV